MTFTQFTHRQTIQWYKDLGYNCWLLLSLNQSIDRTEHYDSRNKLKELANTVDGLSQQLRHKYRIPSYLHRHLKENNGIWILSNIVKTSETHTKQVSARNSIIFFPVSNSNLMHNRSQQSIFHYNYRFRRWEIRFPHFVCSFHSSNQAESSHNQIFLLPPRPFVRKWWNFNVKSLNCGCFKVAITDCNWTSPQKKCELVTKIREKVDVSRLYSKLSSVRRTKQQRVHECWCSCCWFGSPF